ncbi:hypothetical protein MSG28_006005 [Choristoneura fumiferana]|uniref:Uncharacterized protein n=1 Tax=Choristoneura fumiferana TaxID=7141 RepID=A0ACC0L2G8_CHOFU|nr:hypothetical protein MSG28_006005 [Choristoneura fumiferana]
MFTGAFMFQAIEGASEMERVHNMTLERDKTAQCLWRYALELNVFNNSGLKHRISLKMQDYQSKVVVAVRRGWGGTRTSQQWSFSSAFLYSLTLELSDAESIECPEHWRRRPRSPEWEYIMFGSMIFGLWENWDQLDGAYFCFISLSSIGFGDFVPGERVYTQRIETSFIFSVWITMMTIETMNNKEIWWKKYRYVKHKARLQLHLDAILWKSFKDNMRDQGSSPYFRNALLEDIEEFVKQTGSKLIITVTILLKPTKVLFSHKNEESGKEELRSVVAYQNPFTGDYCVHKSHPPKGYMNALPSPESTDSGVSDEYEPLKPTVGIPDSEYEKGKDYGHFNIKEHCRLASICEDNSVNKTRNWNYKEYQI